MTTPEPLTALIFGGSGVIGGAIAQHFGKHRWTVGIHYHKNRSRADHLAKTIKNLGGIPHLLQGNVLSTSEVQRIFQSFTRRYQRIHVLIWAVGTSSSTLTVKITPEEWEQTIQINLSAAFTVLQEAGKIFTAQKDGALIAVGSFSGAHGEIGQTAYAASKAGLVALIRSAAKEWGNDNIRVNVIFPGWHPSPLTEDAAMQALRTQSHALERTPQLVDVADTVYHLALRKDISGQVWNLDSRIG